MVKMAKMHTVEETSFSQFYQPCIKHTQNLELLAHKTKSRNYLS